VKPIHRFFASGYDLRDIMFKRLREDIRTIKERSPESAAAARLEENSLWI